MYEAENLRLQTVNSSHELTVRGRTAGKLENAKCLKLGVCSRVQCLCTQIYSMLYVYERTPLRIRFAQSI